MSALTPVDDAELGPRMRALASDKQRAFVLALLETPDLTDDQAFAARVAGYGTPDSSAKSISAIASRLMSDELVHAALCEEAHRRFRGLGRLAVASLDRILRDQKHPKHAHVAVQLASLLWPAQASLKVEHRHEHRHEHRLSSADLERARERIAELAARLGVPPIVDAQFTEVAAS
jgi:phage terminase small subunit